MNSPFITKKQLTAAITGTVFISLARGIPAAAATFSPEPLFDAVDTFTTIIAADGDPADIYFPVVTNLDPANDPFPIALLLQGGLVDKSDYSNFASLVASYGFVVAVPNHIRTLMGPTGPVKGLFPEQQQLNTVLAHMVAENSNPLSPVNGIVDSNRLGLLGHSFGGAIGLNAIQGTCSPPICFGEFNRPVELMGGVFYGASLTSPFGGSIPPLNNDGIPTGLVVGSRDGVVAGGIEAVEETFNQIQDPPKLLVTVLGANHYGITNDDQPLLDPLRPTLDQTVATETIARWSALFLRAHVLSNEGAFDFVHKTGDALDPNVNVISQTKPIPEPASVFGILAFGVLGAGSLRQRQWKAILKS